MTDQSTSIGKMMPDEPQTVDPIIEWHRKMVESGIRSKIGFIFCESPAWSEGGLELALRERKVSMFDFYRHRGPLGIRHTRISEPSGLHWFMYYVPDNWRHPEAT